MNKRMKKIENWLDRGALASIGMFLVLLGVNFLDCITGETTYFSVVNYVPPFIVCSGGIGMMTCGALCIYLAYQKWKKDKT